MPASPDVIQDPPVAPPTDKPGYATTEFWVTLTGTVITFVTALLAILTPGFKLDPLVSAAVGAFCPVAAMIGAGFYAMSRARTKQATGEIARMKMGIDYDREEKRKAWEITTLYNADVQQRQAEAVAAKATTSTRKK